MFSQHKKSILAVVIASTGLAGCLSEGGQTSDNASPVYQITNPQLATGTHPVFAPLETAFPIPSDALFFLDPSNDGTMLDGTDPANPVTTGLGLLDGNSVLAGIDIKISDSLAADQVLDGRSFVEVDGVVVPNPDQNVFLLKLEYPGGDSVYQAEGEVAGLVEANIYRRAVALRDAGDTAAADDLFRSLLEPGFRVELLDIDGGSNNLIRLLPTRPLDPKTKYAAVLTNDIVDARGEPLVGSPTFQSVSDPQRVLSNAALTPFRQAMLPARQLAADFFAFRGEFLGGQQPGFEDVTFATGITTTAVEDVLLANAAPVTFFTRQLGLERKQAAIGELLAGTFNLSGQPLGSGASAEHEAINGEIYRLLTDSAYRLYDASLAAALSEANAAGLTVGYGDLVTDADSDRRLAFTLQAATADAVTNVVDVSAEAATLASAAEPLLDTPKPRAVRVFSQKEGGEVNPALEQTAIDLGFTQITVNPQVFEGEITLPYYQSLPEAGDGTPIQAGSWQPADLSSDETLPVAASDRITYRYPFAAKQADTKVPVVIVTPDEDFGAPPANGYPVIIYQHAATTDRSAILPMATAAGLLCLQDGSAPVNSENCFVTVGIDQPLHGIFDTGLVGLTPITGQPGASADASERHFGFAASDTLAAVPADQVTEPGSGDLFLNFTNYANTRDNMRQGTLDLLNVNASIQAIEDAINQCNAAGSCANGINLNPDRVYFISHSLSGMGGVPFPVINNLAAQSNGNLTPVLASVLFNTGGQFTRIAENSPSIAPRLLPTLDAASGGLLAQGRTELNIYLNVFQGLLDSADPTAFAPLLQGTPTLMTSIVGVPDDPDRPTDGTMPNAADDLLYDLGPLALVIPETGFQINGERSPLAGTDPLAAAMGAASTPLADGGFPAITRFLEGAHGNPISAGQKASEPFSSGAVFNEMAAQMRVLFINGTTAVFNPCVVKDADTTGVDCTAQTDAGETAPDGGGDGGGNDGDGTGGGIGDIIGIIPL